MKVIIAGSRTIILQSIVETAILSSNFIITEVVSGKARGVDTLGEIWARRNKIPIKEFPADWERFGKRAGFIRNDVMSQYAEGLIVVWDGESRGTLDMIERAKKKGLKVYVYIVGIGGSHYNV